MTLYRYSISWTRYGGAKFAVRSDPQWTPVDALSNALAVAVRLGWTPPRWWQWWRWSDTRIDWAAFARSVAEEARR